MRAPTSVLALLLTGALVAGCSGMDADDHSTASAGDSSLEAPAAMAEGNAGGSTAGSGQDPQDLSSFRIAPGDVVIRTAELDVRVDDVGKAADAAGRLARDAGGRVESEERSGDGDGGSATVRLRVPPADFDKAVADLVALGDERRRLLGSEDLGEQVADLDARLATQRASVERVRALLGEADALGEVVQIESELTKRTADLEALQARLGALEARVALSSVVVHFDSQGGPVVGDALGFGDGLEAGWSALARVGRAIAVTSGALLPFVPLLLVAGWFAVRARSRRAAAVRT